MLKILLVDDEMLVRLGIKSCINFEELGLQLIGEASNGQEALEIVERELPDIILLDIKMPVMDGLQFLNIVNKKGIHTNIIILSCYNDFEYVKEALKLGAKDYILKLSIKPDEINELLGKISQGIMCNVANELHHENNARQQETVSFIRNLVFTPGFDGRIPLHLKNQLENLQYVIIKFSYDYDHIETTDKALINIIQEISKEYGLSIILKGKNELVIFLAFDATHNINDIKEISERIFNTVKTCLSKEMKISIGNILENIYSLRQSYLNACTAYEYFFYQKANSIISYEESDIELDCTTILTKEMEQNIYGILEVFDSKKLLETINTFFDEIIASKQVKKQVIISTSLNIIGILSRFARDNNINIEDILSPSYNCIMDFENIYEFKEWFNLLIEKYICSIIEKQTILKRKDLKKAEEYIKTNCYKKISLSEISNYVNMSENYFSYLFKKEFNDTFINYQNKVKIFKAKELLLQGDYKINELSDKLGYTDQGYFCKVFKKILGISPEQFKMSLSKKTPAQDTRI